MWSEFYFAHPLWLLVLIVIVIWFFLTRHKACSVATISQPIAVYYPLLNVLNHSQHNKTTHNNRLGIAIILCLLTFSLAQPALKTAIKSKPNDQQNVDLILVVNTAVSMVLRDYQEENAAGELKQFDRMTKTKQVLKQVVSQFNGQRIGLVVLGNPAAVWLPLTTDKQLVLKALGTLQTTLGGRTSDMGAALQLVNEQFKSKSTAQKMLLLVNDGYFQIGATSPLEAVKRLVKNHFIIHTLAIGSPKRPDFSLGIGHLIYSPVNLNLMRSLAKAGKGKMVHAWQNNSADEVLKAIRLPNTKPVQTSTRFKNTAFYHYPLSVAMLILLLMLFPLHTSFFKRND